MGTFKLLRRSMLLSLLAAASFPAFGETIATADLLAGQTILVGSVSVDRVSGRIDVTYQTDPGWCLFEVHAHIAETADGVPRSRGGPIPGRFAVSDESLDCVSSYTASFDDMFGNDFVVAAHAVVDVDDDCEPSEGDGGPTLFALENRFVRDDPNCDPAVDFFCPGSDFGIVEQVDVNGGLCALAEVANDSVPLLPCEDGDDCGDVEAPYDALAWDGAGTLYLGASTPLDCSNLESDSEEPLFFSSALYRATDDSSDLAIAPALVTGNENFLWGPATGATWSDGLYQYVAEFIGRLQSVDPTAMSEGQACAERPDNPGALYLFGDIAVDPVSGIIYGSAVQASCAESGGEGAPTEILSEFFTLQGDCGYTQVCTSEQDQCAAGWEIAFGADGVLYGQDGNGDIRAIDTSTGLAGPSLLNCPSYADLATGPLLPGDPVDCPEGQDETAWGDGEDFPGGNWATYIEVGDPGSGDEDAGDEDDGENGRPGNGRPGRGGPPPWARGRGRG